MSQPDPTLDLLLSVFSDTLGYLKQAVSDIPDERFTEQPGACVNHPAWTLSHLCTTAVFMLQLLDEPTDADPADFKRFGPGSVPTATRTDYDSKESLLSRLTSLHARVDAAVRAKHTAYFPRESPEFVRKFSPTVGRIVVYLLGAHESYHLGQLNQWRRAAGLAGA